MKLSNRLFRERSGAIIKQTVTFNAPGTYYPPYGKTAFLLQGQGQPGNTTVNSTYAGINAGSGGNYAGINAGSGGNTSYNAATAGNYAGVTGGVYTQNKNYAPGGGPGTGINASSYTAGTAANCPPNVSVQNDAYNFYTENYTCTPYYNPPIPGNAYTNPYVPGNAYYNPYVPGNAYYNPYVAGTASPNYNVLGVALPGGAADTAATVVGYVAVSIDYSSAGVAITCPPGGYIKIQNV